MKPNLFRWLPVVLALTALPATVSAAAEREVLIPSGTVLHVRMENSVGSDISRSEEPVRGVLTRPVVVRGRAAVPAGSTVIGHVIGVRRAGHLRGRSAVTVRFSELKPRGEAETYRIRTRSWSALGPTPNQRDLKGIGLPAAGGAIIGAIIGGGKGAAIGGAAGAGAGTARLMVTRARDVRVPRGAVVAVRMTGPARVEVPERVVRR